MDVHCSTCNEPWDAHHVRHDAVYETDLSTDEAQAWRTLPTSLQLAPRYREKFKMVGWEFGRSVLNVTKCPCCPPDTMPDPEKLALKWELEQIFGNDQDGLSAAFEEYGL